MTIRKGWRMQEPKTVMEIFGNRWVDGKGVIHQPESVKTGFTVIDEVIHSYMPADLTVIIGHVSMGRTAFLLTTLYQTALMGLPVVYCTVQNRQYYVGRRLMSFAIDYDVRMQTELNIKTKCSAVKNKINSLKTFPAYVIDESAKAFTIDAMIDRVSDLMKEVTIKLILIDDPHLMEGKERDILIRLKHFAIDRQIPVVVSIQAPDVLPVTPRKVMSYLDEVIVYVDNIITINRLEYPKKEQKQHLNMCPLYIIDVKKNHVENVRLDFDKRLGKFIQTE